MASSVLANTAAGSEQESADVVMRRVHCVVTGASRGFGRSVACALVRTLRESGRKEGKGQGALLLNLVLCARSEAALQETAQMVREEAGEDGLGDDTSGLALEVETVVADLADLDAVSDIAERLFRGLHEPARFELCLLVNNAGTVRPVQYCGGGRVSSGSVAVARDLREAMDLNVTSFMCLTNQFAQVFAGQAEEEEEARARLPRACVMNVSSLVALQPFESMGPYCAGKAARDMYCRVLAKEPARTRAGVVETLSYAPGPMATNMLTDMVGADGIHAPIREYFDKAREENTLVDPTASARKCVGLVLAGRFASGEHIDFFDNIDDKTGAAAGKDDEDGAYS